MSNGGAIAITGLGMISPVGLNAVQSCAAVRAGVNRFQEFEDYLCQPGEPELDFEPMKGARVPALGLGTERFADLMQAALQDLIQNAQLTRARIPELGMYLATPDSTRIGPPEIFAESIGKASDGLFQELRAFAGGNAGFFLALEEAIAALSQGRCRAAVVAAVDSYHLAPVLALLDEAGRLSSERNLDGFLPGEAAAAILVESRSAAESRGASVLATLQGVGRASEEKTVHGDVPSSGIGLAQAISAVVGSRGGPAAIDWVACDMNGESYRASEWGHCQVNLLELFRGLRHVWHPADCLGDVGGASGAVLACLVARAFQRGYAPADHCLVWASSDEGLRAATLLWRS
jgi:3-oxoacyl-[acyl-carrier-protein] synthase-1